MGRDCVWSLPWHNCGESISWNNKIKPSSRYPKLFWNAWRLTSERDGGCNSKKKRGREELSERGRERNLWRGRRVVACSQKYFSLLSLELNHWIIYYSTNLNVKRLRQLERERERRESLPLPTPPAHPNPSTTHSPPPQPTTLKVCSPDHRHAYFMRRGRELWWKDGGVTVGRSWSVYCPHQRLIIMSACKIAWYYLILPENWNSCRGGRGRSPPRRSRLQPSGLSGRRAPSLQEDQRGLGSVRTWRRSAPSSFTLADFDLKSNMDSTQFTFMLKLRMMPCTS